LAAAAILRFTKPGPAISADSTRAGVRGAHRGDQRLRHLARVAPERLGDLQREVAGEVAVAGLLRAFEHGAGAADGLDRGTVAAGPREPGRRGLERLGEAALLFG
jgi:hypothetical protein